jgi:hypothetical protein
LDDHLRYEQSSPLQLHVDLLDVYLMRLDALGDLGGRDVMRALRDLQRTSLHAKLA